MEQNDGSNILNQVTKIERELKDLEKQKETLQESCKHAETRVAFNKSKDMRLFCKQCKKEVGWPTQAQQEEFLGINKKDGYS
jgi:hypothetical protein